MFYLGNQISKLEAEYSQDFVLPYAPYCMDWFTHQAVFKITLQPTEESGFNLQFAMQDKLPVIDIDSYGSMKELRREL